MKKISLLLSIILVSNLSFSQSVDSYFLKAHELFKTNVSNGKVAYAKIKKNPQLLDELIALGKKITVAKTNPEVYQAFWINAYNITVIKSIVDNYPIKSPLDKAGFFDKKTHKIAGKSVTLNDIENKLLRAEFKDPRFHFVLVCGAIGCPPLINKAYKPGILESQLDAQTKLAINGSFVKVNTKKKTVLGSEILKWYKEDFVKNGTEIDFLNAYRTEKIPSNFKLSYFTYNWNVNKQ